MKFTALDLKGAFLIDIEKLEDARGFFARCFCEKEFSKNGLNTRWVQMNNSMSTLAGTLRGIHLQMPPHAEVKLIRCLKGAIWDVIIDLRQESETYRCWFGKVLSEENRTMMYLPKGFGHGFITLEPNSEVLYQVSECYAPESEATLLWNDPDIGIDWPLEPIAISEKDSKGELLNALVDRGWLSQLR